VLPKSIAVVDYFGGSCALKKLISSLAQSEDSIAIG
jgi:hypothetical protein